MLRLGEDSASVRVVSWHSTSEFQIHAESCQTTCSQALSSQALYAPIGGNHPQVHPIFQPADNAGASSSWEDRPARQADAVSTLAYDRETGSQGWKPLRPQPEPRLSLSLYTPKRSSYASRVATTLYTLWLLRALLRPWNFDVPFPAPFSGYAVIALLAILRLAGLSLRS